MYSLQKVLVFGQLKGKGLSQKCAEGLYHDISFMDLWRKMKGL